MSLNVGDKVEILPYNEDLNGNASKECIGRIGEIIDIDGESEHSYTVEFYEEVFGFYDWNFTEEQLKLIETI